MQLGLFIVVVFLNAVDLPGSGSSGKALKGKRQRRSATGLCFEFSGKCATEGLRHDDNCLFLGPGINKPQYRKQTRRKRDGAKCKMKDFKSTASKVCVSTEMSQGCAKGCELCSEFNGCLKCSPKLFILLERNDMRQIGICLPSCPLGYFDLRNPDMNKCIKCKIENCEDCFSRNFCTKCKEGLFLHKGRCYAACPEGSSATNGTIECSSPAQCEMSEWGPWGPCSKKRRLCGFRKGNEARSRKILQAPAGDVSLCPATTELRRCTVQRTQCPEEQRKKKEDQGRRDNMNEDRNRKDARDGRSGGKRRRGQLRGTVVPVTSAQ